MQQGETLEGELAPPPAIVRGIGAPVKTVPAAWKPANAGVAERFRAAVQAGISARRVFVLWPFAMILGLIGYSLLPEEPSGLALGALVATMGAVLLAMRQASLLLACSLPAACLLGACVLPVHGLWF
ncbi:MAG: hypothetical protein KKF33_12280, partial [Alphaproteobacteria bacterium]|nr:hypothetical protein [Alphaproteobacteria bacterium]